MSANNRVIKYWIPILFFVVLLLPAGSVYASLKLGSWLPTAASPVKIADVYGHASNINSGKERAQAYKAIIIHSGFADKVRHVREAGFRSPILQYIIADALIGPAGLYSVESQQKTCEQLGISDIQPQLNNINMSGDFCTIHDSIVTGKPLVDLDLDGSGDMAASESWFIHDGDGKRIYRATGGGTGYYPNPGNPGLRQFFLARLLHELKKNQNEYLFDGIYLDNVALGYGNTDRHNREPVEFPTQEDAGDAVFGFVQFIYEGIKAENKHHLLWANLIGGNNDSKQWDRFSKILDGGLNEDFAITWSTNPHPPEIFYNQLLQAQKWIRNRNAFVGVAQGDGSSRKGEFGLAAFLLITDGINGYYHYTDNRDMYNGYFEYPDYSAALGYPVQDFRVTGRDDAGHPISYQREFECGTVTLDLSEQTYSIRTKEVCQFQHQLQRTPRWVK